jgi:alpha-amylase/alpha-mannosidase (GH57 family)
MGAGRVDLLLLWHMHQPDYRDHARGEFDSPWVYLHAAKDYTDMAAHLERHPRVHAVVNFVPVLLDQLEDYAAQFRRGELRDPLLRLLGRPRFDDLDAGERRLILESCFHGNHLTMVMPFPPYRRLQEMYRVLQGQEGAALDYLSGAYFADLITWYHIAWSGETERRRQPLLAELMSKGERYSHADRVRLLALIGKTIQELVPRYRALADSRRIELSTTPGTHPLAPLLIDFAAARESEPHLTLPLSPCYPGGRLRVAAQLRRALATHTARFGSAAAGVWPAEGALSDAFLQLLAHQGAAWTASSETVLLNSLRVEGRGAERERCLYRPYRVAGAGGLTVFFRDERLSDLIAFEYSKWHSGDAARDFIARIEGIGKAAEGPGVPLVTIIVDGENAWESYPYNGFYFLSELYGALESHPAIRTVTPSAHLAQPGAQAGELKHLVAGSWVYGTLSTWIGHADKNRAWDLLCAAKQSYDLVTLSERLSAEECVRAESLLAVCEGSDWFWWLGDYNPPRAVASFERMFRRNLMNLYAALGLPAPAHLGEVLSHGVGAPELGGTIRRAH